MARYLSFFLSKAQMSILGPIESSISSDFIYRKTQLTWLYKTENLNIGR